jgi:hypothetical protein
VRSCQLTHVPNDDEGRLSSSGAFLALTSRLIHAANGPRTSKSHEVGLRAFYSFARLLGIKRPIPPSTSLLLDFVTHQALYLGKSHTSIVGYLGAVKHLCKSLNLSVDQFHRPVMALQLRGLRRLNPPKKRPPRVPITIWLLTPMFFALDLLLHEDALFWAASTVCVYGVLRAGVVSYVDIHSSTLRRLDVTWFSSHVQIFIVIDKTHQFGNGATVHLYRNGATSCPYTALRRLWDIAPLQHPQAPLFQQEDGSPLTYQRLLSATKNLLAQLGFPRELVGTHSFKIGAATSLAFLGYSADFIRALGMWSWDSVCFHKYLRISSVVFRQISLHLSYNSGDHTRPFGDLTLHQACGVTLNNIDAICRS